MTLYSISILPGSWERSSAPHDKKKKAGPVHGAHSCTSFQWKMPLPQACGKPRTVRVASHPSVGCWGLGTTQNHPPTPPKTIRIQDTRAQRSSLGKMNTERLFMRKNWKHNLKPDWNTQGCCNLDMLHQTSNLCFWVQSHSCWRDNFPPVTLIPIVRAKLKATELVLWKGSSTNLRVCSTPRH